MKKLVLLAFGFLTAAAPAYAGRGTIEETDTAIIVEYTGDAKDRAPDAAPQESGRTATEADGSVPNAAAPMVVAKGGMQEQGVAKSQSSSHDSRSKKRQLRREALHRPDQDLSRLAPPPASTGAKD